MGVGLFKMYIRGAEWQQQATSTTPRAQFEPRRHDGQAAGASISGQMCSDSCQPNLGGRES
jgi:hypothetical protein